MVFANAGVAPDLEFIGQVPGTNFLFTHRHSPASEIYFISNQKNQPQSATCAFRVTGQQPELWNAVTGERRVLTDWRVQDGRTVVPLEFAPRQSWFVVFRKSGGPPEQIVANFPKYTVLQEISGAWQVSFAPGWGAPEQSVFDQLTDWTKRPEPGIKYFSGAATYRRTFDLPASALQAAARIFLDLGEVHQLATVRVNGRELTTLWTAPWRVEVASALKPGENTLEVEVVNGWNNRVVGDASLPADQRLTWLARKNIYSRPKTPLMKSGLLGPVTLQVERR
jgi:hypothetical protein